MGKLSSKIQVKIKKGTEVVFERRSIILLHNDIFNPDLPQNASVALLRLHIGHEYLAAHLDRLSILPCLQCILCREPNSMVGRVHLLQCRAISKIISDINPHLSITGMEEGEWRTSKNLSISNQPAMQEDLYTAESFHAAISSIHHSLHLSYIQIFY